LAKIPPKGSFKKIKHSKIKWFWKVSIARSEKEKVKIPRFFYIWFSMCSHKSIKGWLKILYFIYNL
jgi:hypothetical protein